MILKPSTIAATLSLIVNGIVIGLALAEEPASLHPTAASSPAPAPTLLMTPANQASLVGPVMPPTANPATSAGSVGIISKSQAEPPTSAATLTDDHPLHIDRIENGTAYFAGIGAPPRPLALEASDMINLGVLRAAPDGHPFFLTIGKPCKNCSIEPMILAFQATSSRLYKFVAPGRVLDHKTRSIVMESRAFYGRCLTRRVGDVYLVFQKERVDRRKGLQSSVFFAEPAVDPVEHGKALEHLHETLLERHEPRLNDTLKLVRNRVCHEIEGRYRVTTSHPMDVNLKRQKVMDEEDSDEETPKENQTDRDITQ